MRTLCWAACQEQPTATSDCCCGGGGDEDGDADDNGDDDGAVRGIGTGTARLYLSALSMRLVTMLEFLLMQIILQPYH